MKTTVTKLSDSQHQITFVHKEVEVTRTIDTPFTDKKKIDQKQLSEKVEYLASAIESKIDMGLITKDTLTRYDSVVEG